MSLSPPGLPGFTEPPALVRPDVPVALAREVVADAFGLQGTVRELGSNQERTFTVDTADGRYVLKVAHPSFADAELEAQDAALAHLALRAPGLLAPRSVPTTGGGLLARFDGPEGPLRARLLTWVPGRPLGEDGHLAPVVVGRLGELAGQVAVALADLRAPGLDRLLQWDVRQARSLCALLAPYLPDPGRRSALLAAVDAACDRLDALAPDLRVQPVHGDVTDDNVVCDRGPDGRAVPVGVIDLGDVALGWVVGDLAATCASVLHHVPGRPLAVLPAVRAYDRHVGLTDAEVAALWPALVARGAALVVSGVHQGVIEPGNAYAASATEREWRMFTEALALPADVATAALREALGRPLPPVPPPALSTPAGRPLLPALAGRDVAVVDLTVTTGALHDGGWLEPGAEDALVEAALRTAPAALLRHGEARLTRTVPGSVAPPATVALGVEVACAAGTELHAPFAGTLSADGDTAVLSGAGVDLLLTGVAAGPAGPREAGQPLGATTARVRVQLCTVPGLRPPALVRPEEAAGWRAVSPDPTPLLHLAAVPNAVGLDAAALMRVREEALAGVQEHYYDAPPRIERGWRHSLLDTGARTYLDAVNNVAGCGHAHPRITRAVARQWDLLNTNSRFHYAALPEFSARLAALLPDPLDTVFLVNSGSEAVDLALRLAWTATGRKDVFCVAEAYHGWTVASDAVSTSVADNPQALSTRPAWVHPLLAPNPYRGRFRGPDAGARYVEDARAALAASVAQGRPPAAFLCEAVYGNAGGIPLPDGYLQAVYGATRDAGGLCLADEVQVGYGRLGSTFWGFEQQGVVPDIVTVAKAMGNGHPLGAVITTREIADAFSRNGYFFSSAGGSPVSCAVGMAVLDIVEDEQLQANALTVGAHLRRRFEELQERFPLVGAVHGLGLYLGVELVRDRTTLEPATEETAAICERLLELGVVLQPTGDRLNVLKVKPPLCLDVAGADQLADRLAEVLRDGW